MYNISTSPFRLTLRTHIFTSSSTHFTIPCFFALLLHTLNDTYSLHTTPHYQFGMADAGVKEGQGLARAGTLRDALSQGTERSSPTAAAVSTCPKANSICGRTPARPTRPFYPFTPQNFPRWAGSAPRPTWCCTLTPLPGTPAWPNSPHKRHGRDESRF